MQALEQIVIAFVPVVLANNLVMSALKYATVNSLSNPYMRAVLVFLSLVGVFSTAAYAGTPIDVNSVTGLATAFVEILGVAIASHYNYKIIKNA